MIGQILLGHVDQQASLAEKAMRRGNRTISVYDVNPNISVDILLVLKECGEQIGIIAPDVIQKYMWQINPNLFLTYQPSTRIKPMRSGERPEIWRPNSDEVLHYYITGWIFQAAQAVGQNLELGGYDDRPNIQLQKLAQAGILVDEVYVGTYNQLYPRSSIGRAVNTHVPNTEYWYDRW